MQQALRWRLAGRSFIRAAGEGTGRKQEWAVGEVGLSCRLHGSLSQPHGGLLWEGVTSEALYSYGKPSRGRQVGKQASFLMGTQGAHHRATTLVKREAYHLPRIPPQVL